jgi:hypothetical protein
MNEQNHSACMPLRSNNALVNDACGRRSRAFFSASQRER